MPRGSALSQSPGIRQRLNARYHPGIHCSTAWALFALVAFTDVAFTSSGHLPSSESAPDGYAARLSRSSSLHAGWQPVDLHPFRYSKDALTCPILWWRYSTSWSTSNCSARCIQRRCRCSVSIMS